MQLKPSLPKEEAEHLRPFDECNFEESTYYYVWVTFGRDPHPIKAVIYTGFRSGSYRSAFTGGDSVVQFDHRAKFKVITKIGKSGY